MQGPLARTDLAWDDVRLFLALYRSATASAAARMLGVDTSTVSRRLAAMERTLATALFDRGRSGIMPTQAARELVPIAEEIEGAMLRFATTADGLERDIAGVVRITCPTDVAEVVIAPLLPALLRKHPLLRVDIDADESLVDLARREADLALRVVRPTEGDLIVTRLATVRWTPAASPAFVRALGSLRAWHDVPWIGWGERLAHVPAARWARKHLRGVDPVIRSNSLRVQLAIATAGVGVVLAPERTVPQIGLVPVKLGARLRQAAHELPVDELYLVIHRALRNVPRVRAVRDVLIAELGERG